MFDAMVTKGRGGLAAFAEATATAPARLYGLVGKGSIAPGFDADLVLWDPDRQVTYGADDLHATPATTRGRGRPSPAGPKP
jgi:dihydropyrimidinase